MNLHSHMQYHVLGLWRDAKGQFNNRFEWRKDLDYRNYVSHQMREFKRYSTCYRQRKSDL